jgi:hypothetical protein
MKKAKQKRHLFGLIGNGVWCSKRIGGSVATLPWFACGFLRGKAGAPSSSKPWTGGGNRDRYCAVSAHETVIPRRGRRCWHTRGFVSLSGGFIFSGGSIAFNAWRSHPDA